MRKSLITFFMLFVTFVFAFVCAYSLFDTVQEADFLWAKKYEDRDVGALCAEKSGNLADVCVSTAFFSALPIPLFELLPSFFSPNTLLVTTLSVLRC